MIRSSEIIGLQFKFADITHIQEAKMVQDFISWVAKYYK